MAKRPQARAVTPATIKQTFMLPGELVEQCRDAVVALSGPPVQLTLTRLVTDALRRELARLRKTKHRGRPFPRRGKAGLRVGRPIST